MTWPPNYSELDPGIQETVKFLVSAGFYTTDSGDGITKPETHEGILDFPHVVIRSSWGNIKSDIDALRYILRQRGLEIVPVGSDKPGVALEAAYDVGANVATIMVSGLNDQLLAKHP